MSYVSPKYWAEHMGLPYHQTAIQEGEKFKPTPGKQHSIEQERRFTRYGYADYLREDRAYGVIYRIWPGTQRFLLWGDPTMAAGYGRLSHFCGSLGLELCEPLSFKGRMGSGLAGDRNGYADEKLRPAGGDWEKHLYTYRLWGRLLYNPNADPECWRRYLRTEFGAAAKDCEAALANASRDADMEKLLSDKPAMVTQADAQKISSAATLFNAALALAGAPTPCPRCEHLPPASFRRGQPVAIELAIEPGYNVTQARLHYRHVNQADEFEVVEMAAHPQASTGAGPAVENRYRENIPGTYIRGKQTGRAGCPLRSSK